MKSKTKSKLIIALFLIFIFAVGILYIFLPKNDFSETEKRNLADFPKFNIENLSSGKFASDFEEYLSDHVPFRNFFVSVNSYFELIKGNNGSNGVYLGSDGWLIEKPFDRENRFDINMKRITDFAARTNIPTALTAVPSKGYIYSDKLPKNALTYNDGDYFARFPGKCGDKVKYIDISQAMKTEADSRQLFYRTDHHWTSDGAYIGYSEICKSLGLKPADENDFTRQVTEGFFGTSYSTSLYTFTKPDSITLIRNGKTGGKAEICIDDGKKTYSNNMFFDERLKESDKYTVFLDGNHSLVNITTGNKGEKLLVIKDSFAHCLVPFLAENYSKITMIDLRYYKKPVSALIENEGFDRILFVYGLENLCESNDIILK